MQVLKDVILDLAIVAVLAAFIELLLPEDKMRYPVKLIFGLYFMALLINPVLSLFNKTDLSDLDFREMDITIEAREPTADEQGQVFSLAEASLAAEIAQRCHAMYEDGQFEVTVKLGDSDVESIQVAVRGTAPPLDDIVSFIAATYGVEKSKIAVTVQEEED